jgi:hypothetical protein
LNKFISMTFDNSRTIIMLRIELFVTSIILLSFVILSYFTRILKFPLLGLSETTWTLILVSIWLLIVFLPIILNYQFISYSDDGEKIVFRYFSSGVFGGKKNSVEIDKKSFSGYKAESRLFGLLHTITLFQQYKEGVAKYPPIWLSALTKAERDRIILALGKLTPGS